MSVGHPDVFFGKVSVHVFCPFLNWVICFLGVELISSLQILDGKLLSDMSFAHLFPFHRLPFSFVDCFLCSAGAFYLDEVPIVHFCF